MEDRDTPDQHFRPLCSDEECLGCRHSRAGSCGLPIHHALAFGRLNCQNGALSIVEFTTVPHKVELPKVAVEILFADVVVDADDAALYKGKRTLRRVRVHVATGILTRAMADAFVTASKVLADPPVA